MTSVACVTCGFCKKRLCTPVSCNTGIKMYLYLLFDEDNYGLEVQAPVPVSHDFI